MAIIVRVAIAHFDTLLDTDYIKKDFWGIKMLISQHKNTDNTLIGFCDITSVSYWRSQLHSSNIKNLSKSSGGTKRQYTYNLLGFHRWLSGKQFQYTITTQADDGNLRIQKKTITLEGVDHLLRLYQNDFAKKIEFVALVKKYLIQLQTRKSAGVIDSTMFAIKSFFRENDSEINFRFNNTKRRSDPMIENTMTIDDLKKILTVKKLQPIEKAVLLCKFQRGLDSITFADRFNFDAWTQLVDYFGTNNPKLWDLSLCPVPIKLVRVKTNYLHTGFLDKDAIAALQEYLKKRTVASIQKKALFLDTQGNPISINWIGRRFAKLRKNSKLSKTYSSHEMRDLLKSTLIDSGCRPDIADHVIGHAPKDSYEKQALLYPDSIRTEFMKASDRINVLQSSTPRKNKIRPIKQSENKQIIEKLLEMSQEINSIIQQLMGERNDL